MAISSNSHHFLLVENDATEATILDKAFQAIPDCGTVSIARNVSEAKAYLRGAGLYSDREKFPLPSTILSSLQIDGDSGVELLSWTKEDAGLRLIPFVLLAPASAAPSEIAAAKRGGATRVVKKPMNSVELKKMLERLAEAICSGSADSCHTDF